MTCIKCNDREAGAYTEGGIKTSLCDSCFDAEFPSRDQAPSINSVLFVSDESLEAMSGWPIEMRAIFDPQADRELAQRIESEKRSPTASSDDDLPF